MWFTPISSLSLTLFFDRHMPMRITLLTSILTDKQTHGHTYYTQHEVINSCGKESQENWKFERQIIKLRWWTVLVTQIVATRNILEGERFASHLLNRRHFSVFFFISNETMIVIVCATCASYTQDTQCKERNRESWHRIIIFTTFNLRRKVTLYDCTK